MINCPGTLLRRSRRHPHLTAEVVSSDFVIRDLGAWGDTIRLMPGVAGDQG